MQRQKNKVTPGVLAILLGGLGIHKFYLSKIGMGIFYLIFCWTFLPAIAGLIEGIIYLVMDDREFAQKYGGGLLVEHLTALQRLNELKKRGLLDNDEYMIKSQDISNSRRYVRLEVLEQLKRLATLKEEGVLNEDQIETEKKSLLEKL